MLFSPRAAADLDEIAAYIARDNPGRAATFIDELEAQCKAVARAPLNYPAREDLAAGVRMAVFRRYLILFRELPQTNVVRIERVVHGARNLRHLF
ncbi:MAG TPA: type II toxin-antitoxin system RelE/ParE family toxin [Stellaceae bacterium]|nr:type II toxin-antitoxin system RelE/ParE family toxin [Stellaceae bacterium]